MIEDGENIERNSSEEIEWQGMCVCVCIYIYIYIYIDIEHLHVLLKLYIYLLILLFIEYVKLLCTIYSNMYRWNQCR